MTNEEVHELVESVKNNWKESYYKTARKLWKVQEENARLAGIVAAMSHIIETATKYIDDQDTVLWLLKQENHYLKEANDDSNDAPYYGDR